MSTLSNPVRSRWPLPTRLPRPRLTIVPKVASRAPRVPFVILVVLVLGGGLIGLLLGLATGLSRSLQLLIDGPVQMLRAIPALALVPLVILWLGLGEAAKLFIVAVTVLFPVYLNTFHGVRSVEDLAYRDYFEKELPQHEFLGETIRERLLYYPAVTREDFPNRGRLTDLMASGEMMKTLGIEALDHEHDRAMICGSPQMLADFRALLDGRGFTAAPRIGTAGQYVFERAFVEK